jgi:hypothetical protein
MVGMVTFVVVTVVAVVVVVMPVMAVVVVVVVAVVVVAVVVVVVVVVAVVVVAVVVVVVVAVVVRSVVLVLVMSVFRATRVPSRHERLLRHRPVSTIPAAAARRPGLRSLAGIYPELATAITRARSCTPVSYVDRAPIARA